MRPTAPAPAPTAHGVVVNLVGIHPLVETDGYVLITDTGDAYHTLTSRLGNYRVADVELGRVLLLVHNGDRSVHSIETV